MNDKARERLLQILEARRKAAENPLDGLHASIPPSKDVCPACNGERVIYKAIAADLDRFYKGSTEDKARDPRFRAEPCPLCQENH